MTDARGEIAAILIDVPGDRFDRVVAFWAEALSATPETMGDMPGDDAYVFLAGATAATDVLVQRVDGGPRIHLDVAVADREAAVARAVEVGGRAVHRETGWEVVRDPAGLPCCIGFEDPDPLRTAPRRSDRGFLDAAFLDVPTDDVDAEVAFWAELLGASVAPVDPDDPAYRELVGVRAVGGAPFAMDVQAVGVVPRSGREGVDPSRDGPATAPRVHVDLSVADVMPEVARLEGLGATRIGEVEDWVTLADPAGNLLCVVPDEPSQP